MSEIRKIHVWPFARSVSIFGAETTLIIPTFVVIVAGMLEAVFWGYGSMDVEYLIEIFLEEEFIFFYIFIISVTTLVSLVLGALGAFVYNLISEKLGGIQMDINYLGTVEKSQE
ncbi:MAG: hypothetical protein U9O20_04100 [Patescibacteria group bacterium]|nr:hypothetical protein [Patescibacteria group bacterium]